jgi:phospholipid/cholesterol/gamma-HCH transport system permease protein
MTDDNLAAKAVLDRLTEASGIRLVPRGSWQISAAAVLEEEIDRVIADRQITGRPVILDLSDLHHLDTTGAWLVNRLADGLVDAGVKLTWAEVPDNAARLLRAINAPPIHDASDAERPWTLFEKLFAPLGYKMAEVGKDLMEGFSVFGEVVAGVQRCIRDPRRLRWTSVVHHLDRTGFQAVPIVFLMSFLIGGIIAQQGAFQLRSFGASLFVVDLVGILVLREIGVLLTAIMLAGRSGSAYTAEIGSMKMREEIDAIKVIGLHPVEILIVPRIMALVIALPLLTFISDVAALMGGALVSLLYVDISLPAFLSRLQNAVAINTLMVGLIKAPFMALIVGLVAANEGLRVQGSAESLGRHTTASVVKAIFMVIVADGFFAIFFASIGY